MAGGLGRAQLQHVAQHRDLAPALQRGQRLQRGFGRGRGRAVGVVQQQAAAAARERVEPAGEARHLGQPRQDRGQRHLAGQPDRDGRQRGVDLVPAQEGEVDMIAAGRGLDIEAQALAGDDDVACQDVGGGIENGTRTTREDVESSASCPKSRTGSRSGRSPTVPGSAIRTGSKSAECDHAAVVRLRRAATRGSSALSTASPWGGSAATSSPFPRNGLQRAEGLQVGRLDGRDDRDLRRRDLAEPGHLAEVIGGHLQHRDPVFGPQLAQRDRQAVEAVVVGAVLEDRELPRQHRRNRLFGRGLADAAGDADDRQGLLI